MSKSRQKDTNGINTIVKEEETKLQKYYLLQIKRPKDGQWAGTDDAVAGIDFF